MFYYKVLYKKYNGKLVSIGEAFDHPPDLILEYKPGEKTKAPKGTMLFVFESLYYALRFVNHLHSNHSANVEIWEVETNSLPLDGGRVAAIGHWQSKEKRLDVVNRFWLNKRGTIYDSVPSPKGTNICKEVTLIKKV